MSANTPVNTLKFLIKQYLKMLIQGVFLPALYLLYRRRPVDEKKVIFADAHHDSLPFSMLPMHRAIESMGFQVLDFFCDYGEMNRIGQLRSMAAFMKIYPTAKYVFICDYFLPAASCSKKKQTKVIQLWHSGGLLKTMGFEAPEDIPTYYKLNPHKNYDLVTVSAPCCVPVFARSMHLPARVIRPAGISRSDVYFDPAFLEDCIREFYRQYPGAHGRKIVLWAPTFRGNASRPSLCGTESILRLQKELGEEWLVLIKVHPYLDRISQISNCPIPTERLLPVTDLLITDYSSVLFDYLLFEKPFVLFAPDFQTYTKERGFYIDYDSLPAPIVIEGKDLAEAVRDTLASPDREALRECRRFHMGSCDGKSTSRILSLLMRDQIEEGYPDS